MLRSFGRFGIRRERMYREQKPLPTGIGGRPKQKDAETSRETVQRLVKNDPGLAKRLYKLRGKTTEQSNGSKINTPEKIAKRANAIKAQKTKPKRRPNREWMALNKKLQPKLKFPPSNRH